MTVSRQLTFALIIVAAVAVGGLAYERGWFHGSTPGEVASAQTAGPNAGNAAGTGGAGQARGQRSGGGAGFAGGRGGPVLVVTDAVETDTTGIQVSAVGTVAASRAVTIFPQVTGVVTDVAFHAGDLVSDAQPLIKLDDADQQVAVDKAQLGVQNAQAAYDRATQLAKTNNATAVAVSDAKTALDQAQIDLRSAQLDLAKRTITAPFAGTVGLTDLSVGDLVNSQKAIATVDDMSTVTVSFSVPERASGLVKIGDAVTATTDALAGQKFAGKVTAVDSRVDPTTRALNVQATLPNDADALKPGMALTVDLEFPGTPHPAVSSLAIQWDRQGSYVWKVADGKTHRVGVQIIVRRSGVVTVAGDLKEGDRIVTEGVLRVREGSAVTEAGAQPTGQGTPPAGSGTPQAGSDPNGGGAARQRPPQANSG
jgi:RND family efflux transporter MFP subunit